MKSIAFILNRKDYKFCKADKFLLVSSLYVKSKFELVDNTPIIYNSYKVYMWLMEQSILPRTIYFLQREGLYFFTLQAKNLGLYFQNTNIIIIKNGTTLERLKKSKIIGDGRIYDLKVDYIENYCYKKLLKNNNLPTKNPFVSICISHYNHGKYLPYTLEALKNSTYKNFEVIVIDSESNDDYSLKIFKDMKKKYDSRFKFFYESKKSLGAIRNLAVSISNGEYIIFVDSDNIPFSNMIEIYIKSILYSNCDCLTCHNIQFTRNCIGKIFTPIGSSLSYGIFENCFGDANFCIKKQVFCELGGFYTESNGLEDWEFLSRLSLKGYKLEVVPKYLYKYRLNENSMSKTVNQYDSLNQILKVYMENEPKHIQEIVINFCIPIYKNGWKQFNNIDQTTNPINGMYMGGILLSFMKILNQVFPKGSNRREILKKLISLKNIK